MALLHDVAPQDGTDYFYPELAKRISRACGPLHETLNHLIMSGLPIALPPKAKDTRLYAAGLSSFGMIYLTFEEMWQEITSLKESSTQHERDILAFLANLRPRGIERSPRLRADLRYLRSASDDDMFASLQTEGPAERAFRRHIQQMTETKPHTLYAYGWTMYMAIFAGGRYVRKDLAEAGEGFWRHHGYSQNPHTVSEKRADLDRLGYSFLSFDADDDGNAMDRQFRHHLDAAEKLFSDSEKEDVVDEAQAIFNLTIDLVKEMRERIRPHLLQSDDSSSPPPYSPPPYESRIPGFRNSVESNSLLQLRADEEELAAWREPPLKRGFWFRVKIVVLAIIAGLIGSTLIFGVRWRAPWLIGTGDWHRSRHGSHGWH